MITNREEVIDKAFRVFLKMNYEKASISTLAKACGLAKTGIVYYFPHKLDLFVAVADKFFIQLQNPVNKFDQPADTLAEFIDQYVAGVSKAMNGIVSLVNDGNNPYDCCPNFYYIHFLSQVRMYYPGIRQKIEDIFSKDYEMWSTVIQRAKDKGEIRSDVDVTTTARMFRQVFYGISYEHAFLNGLDTNELKEKLQISVFAADTKVKAPPNLPRGEAFVFTNTKQCANRSAHHTILSQGNRLAVAQTTR